MKSKVTNNSTKKEIKFPCLMEYTESEAKGMIVLFTSKTSGTVVYQGASKWEMGNVQDNWVPADYNSWKVFTGTLTLEN